MYESTIILHILPNGLVYTSNLHEKFYCKLLTSQGKSLTLLMMDLRQELLYRCHVLLKVTDASKSPSGESQIGYCLVNC